MIKRGNPAIGLSDAAAIERALRQGADSFVGDAAADTAVG